MQSDMSRQTRNRNKLAKTNDCLAQPPTQRSNWDHIALNALH